MSKALRLIVRHLRGAPLVLTDGLLSSHQRSFRMAVLITQIFYIFSFYFALSSSGWMWDFLSGSPLSQPLWPLFNLDRDSLRHLITPLFSLWILSSMAAAIRPQWFLFRGLQCLSLFYVLVYFNSNGSVGHAGHHLLWASIVFLFLPYKHKPYHLWKRKERHLFINVLWASQFIIGTFYFFSGMWKLVGLSECILSPSVQCELSPYILSNLAAKDWLIRGSFSPLQQLLIVSPTLSLVGYTGMLWMHLSSLYMVFRTDIHDIFGLILVFFHFGTYLFFGIDFSFSVGVIGILFILSPFAQRNHSLRSRLSRLPLIGYPLR